MFKQKYLFIVIIQKIKINKKKSIINKIFIIYI